MRSTTGVLNITKYSYAFSHHYKLNGSNNNKYNEVIMKHTRPGNNEWFKKISKFVSLILMKSFRCNIILALMANTEICTWCF